MSQSTEYLNSSNDGRSEYLIISMDGIDSQHDSNSFDHSSNDIDSVDDIQHQLHETGVEYYHPERKKHVTTDLGKMSTFEKIKFILCTLFSPQIDMEY